MRKHQRLATCIGCKVQREEGKPPCWLIKVGLSKKKEVRHKQHKMDLVYEEALENSPVLYNEDW